MIQVLADWSAFGRLFFGNRHGQQCIFSAGAQLGHRVFVKAFNLQQFLQRHISHFFQTGKAFFDQNISDFLVNIQLGHEQSTRAFCLVGLLLRRFCSVHDVDLPAGQIGRQAHVLPTAANGNSEVFFVHHHIHRMTLFVYHNGADVGRGQRANDKLRGVFAPQHNVYTLACQFSSDRVYTRTAHAYTGANRVNAFVVGQHSNLGTRAGVAGARFNLQQTLLDLGHFVAKQFHHVLRGRA